MMGKITLLVIIGIGAIVFSIFSFQEKEDYRGPVLGEASIMEVMLAFIEIASNEENENVITLRDITVEEQEILDALKLPNLERNEKMIEYGVRISTQYNQASLDYSSEKIRDNEYYTKLYNLRDYYQAYMTFHDSYIGEGDVLIQKKSMIQELIEIEEQINHLKFSENIYDDEQSLGFDKYKKLLPSMFTP
jgi:hypothetical protein